MQHYYNNSCNTITTIHATHHYNNSCNTITDGISAGQVVMMEKPIKTCAIVEQRDPPPPLASFNFPKGEGMFYQVFIYFA